ncbi:MAG: hypothetical protein V4492_05380, partial [Chlamydiota bacterium]
KHKKAILIGAAIVAAATIVICAVSLASAAASAGVAGASAISDSDKETNRQQTKAHEGSTSHETALAMSIPDQSPHLTSALEEHIASFKELVVEEDLLPSSSRAGSHSGSSYGEKARFLGSFLAHEALDGVSELVSVVPGLCQEIIGAGRE